MLGLVRTIGLTGGAVFVFLVVAAGDVGRAAPRNYGTFVGSTVTYVSVTEESFSGDLLPLLDIPMVFGNSIDFNPVGFDANCTGLADNTDSNLTFQIVASSNHAIDKIWFHAAGEVTLAGFGDNSTIASVYASGVLTITEVDGVSVPPIDWLPLSFDFSPSSGRYRLGDAGGGPFFNTLWTGWEFFDIAQILANEGVPYSLGATMISLDFDNELLAHALPGTFALIAIKDLGVTSITVNNLFPETSPEPASWIHLAFGLLTVAILRGRQQPSRRKNSIRG